MSGLDGIVRRILQGEDRSLGATLLRAVLGLFAIIHHIGLELFLLPYRIGIRRQYRLRRADGSRVPVIGIGNLTSGGTGKTPMAALVTAGLQTRGFRVVVLSRGHGGSNEKRRGAQIVSDGSNSGLLIDTANAGDEPILLAQSLPGIPLIVGKDRRISGRLAVERFAPDVIVLDDALQFWQLHRDLDIALLDTRRPFDNGWILPRGLLREPPDHLKKAQIVVLTRADRANAGQLHRAKTSAARYAPDSLVLTAVHAPQCWQRASDGVSLPLGFLERQKVMLFSGIADGASFAQTVADLGVDVVARRDFDDHHRYTASDVEALMDLAADSAAAVTTEKDLVKVAALWDFARCPLYALRVAMVLADGERFWAAVSAAVVRPV